MANQIDNVLLSDDASGLARAIDVGNDDLFLSTDLTLQAGGILVSANIQRGTADPNAGAGTAGNEGDLYQRTLAATGEMYTNVDGTTTGWELQLTRPAHDPLDTLVHDVAETSYFEVTRSGGQVTDVAYWTDSGKTTKIRDTSITRTGGQVSQIVINHYDATGTVCETLTGTITRTSGQVSSISWVLT